jgi:hypothetical protein
MLYSSLSRGSLLGGGKKLNPYEYLIYLQHNVRFMRWLESNPGILTDTIKKAL